MLVQGSHSNVLNHFQDIFELISRTFQDIFELISMTFLFKNVEGISNFKVMEQQSSFQIPNKPKLPEYSLISRTFQDIFHDSRTFQDIFFISRTFQDFPESGNPVVYNQFGTKE